MLATFPSDNAPARRASPAWKSSLTACSRRHTMKHNPQLHPRRTRRASLKCSWKVLTVLTEARARLTGTTQPLSLHHRVPAGVLWRWPVTHRGRQVVTHTDRQEAGTCLSHSCNACELHSGVPGSLGPRSADTLQGMGHHTDQPWAGHPLRGTMIPTSPSKFRPGFHIAAGYAKTKSLFGHLGGPVG